MSYKISRKLQTPMFNNICSLVFFSFDNLFHGHDTHQVYVNCQNFVFIFFIALVGERAYGPPDGGWLKIVCEIELKL